MNNAEYERMYGLEDSYWWFVARHRLVEAIIRERVHRTAPDAPLQILDIGCGTGAMSARLAGLGQVVSADFSQLALQFSRRRKLPHLVGADATRLPFASERFDVLVAMDMLEHLKDDLGALREFHRVLRPGGCLIVTVPAYQHLWSEHDLALMHFRRYVRRELSERVSNAGFRVDKLGHTMAALYPLTALQRRLNARRPPRDPPQASMPMVPSPINQLLTALVTLENVVARRVDLPFGVSIVCVATR